MNRLKRTTATLAVSLLLAACTSYNAFHKATAAETAKNWDEAVTYYEKALSLDPGNMQYKMGLERARIAASRGHFEKGKSYRAASAEATGAEQFRLAQLAATELELTVRLDPTNQYAAVEFGKVVQWLTEAARAADAKDTIDDMKKRAKTTKAQPPQLNPASDQPISLSFPRETPVKDIYRALGNAFGINILFDQAVKDDRIAIELKDVTAQQALERVMQAANHFYKVLDEHTIIVVPDNPQARRDYEDLVIQTFYLSNGDAEQVTNVVRTMIEARNVFPLKALNAITIRDTADKVRIAEKIIEANDKAKSEVVIDVELLEMDANKERNLGLALGASSITQQLVGTDGKAVSNLTLDQLRIISHHGDKHGPNGSFPASPGFWNFTVPSVTYNILKTAGDSQVLAQPQLRISEGEKATLHIGDRIPVPVTSLPVLTAGGTSNYTQATTFQYQDTGIKVSIEPRVHHNREVTLKLTVEVSNVSSYVTDPASNSRQPIISTRTIESTIRLKDGETNFLAGLIQNSETKDGQTVPFIGDIPILGRLFSNEHKTFKSTDLILTMTPHIIRIPDITDDDVAPMWVGTTNNLTFRGVSPRIESQVGTDPFSAPVTPGANMQLSPDGEPGNYIRPDTTNTTTPPPPPTKPPEPEVKLTVPSSTAPAAKLAKDVYVPQGTAPTNVFKTASASAADSATYVPQGSGPNDVFAEKKPTLAAADASLSDAAADMPQGLAPRISPQPITINIKPGEEKLWSLIGMDLDSLTATEIVMNYDPRAINVVDVMFGPALVVDPKTPPAVTIAPEKGSIRITSTNGKPLQFAGGGQIAILRIHGGTPGETFLVLQDPALKNAAGKTVTAVINGGRAKVQ